MRSLGIPTFSKGLMKMMIELDTSDQGVEIQCGGWHTVQSCSSCLSFQKECLNVPGEAIENEVTG
jgi:hypothetical protein